MTRTTRTFLLPAFAALFLGGCPSPTSPPSWHAVAQNLTEALMSVGGTSDRDIWVVGADQGAGPIVLHFDGTAWTRMSTGSRGHLWWVHAISPTEVYLGGASATILRYDGTSFTRMSVPGIGAQTVFGIWGTAGNIYAVGSRSGRAGFVWHFDGTAWTDLPLPSNIGLVNNDIPGLFKVWGSGENVWVVGAAGTVLRRQGSAPFAVESSGTTATLFTVHGNSRTTVMVGGAGQGELRERSGDAPLVDRRPNGAPLLQGIYLQESGIGLASGQGGVIYQRSTDGNWSEADLNLNTNIQSFHATFIDPQGGWWAVGGDVLTPDLRNGAIVHRGSAIPTYSPSASADGGVDADTGPPPVVCPADAIDPEPTHSIARRWNEQLLNAIRRDIPMPGVHARNLFHTSIAMWDAWAAYDSVADGYLVRERQTASDLDAARREAISYAAYHVLSHRYALSAGAAVSEACFAAFMNVLGYDPTDTTATGDTPRALGNRIGQAVIGEYMNDGANEAGRYADNTGWTATNPPLVVDSVAISLPFPSAWQQLNLAEAATQNGIILPAGVQGYIGAHWANVRPFAMTRSAPGVPYHNPGTAPVFGPALRAEAIEVLRMTSWLEVTSDTIDISPGAFGNNPLASNAGTGHPVNPVTGAPYASNVVPRGDFGRVLAEHWADGPRSETPPGHWNTLANYVADQPSFERRFLGQGDPLDALEWDVKMYFALNGAVHDAAVAAWELKRVTQGPRPISLIRYMSSLGQSSDPSLPSYHVDGMTLVPGLVELITAESSTPGQRHERLAAFVGQIAVHSWVGEPGSRATEVGTIGWIRGVEWMPYQRRNFVTPAFPGYVSGHSTFSRSAAEVLTALTGSAFFPGGLGEFVAPANRYLVFERGPSVQVTLQWGTYFDAADQAGQSRLWGGIHVVADDFAGRTIAHDIGRDAAALAQTYFDGTAVN